MVRFPFVVLFCTAIAVATAVPVSAQTDVTDGYLDRFDLTDGRMIDVGELGGGVIGNPNQDKITVTAQPTSPSPPMPTDGRLTGTVHGKFRITFLTDLNGDTFINGSDLDQAFDVAWQLVGFDKDLGPSSAFFVSDVPVGPEGTPWNHTPPASVNFPPNPGGTASTWNVAGCGTPNGFDVGGGTENCNPFAISAATPYTGFVDYTFPISIPGSSDFTPGLTISDINWIITAVVGRTAEAQPPGPITYGRNALFDPQLAVNESSLDLFGPNTLFDFAGEQANVDKGNLLTTVQINVTPEPGTIALVGFGSLLMLRRRRSA